MIRALTLIACNPKLGLRVYARYRWKRVHAISWQGIGGSREIWNDFKSPVYFSLFPPSFDDFKRSGGDFFYSLLFPELVNWNVSFSILRRQKILAKFYFTNTRKSFSFLSLSFSLLRNDKFYFVQKIHPCLLIPYLFSQFFFSFSTL